MTGSDTVANALALGLLLWTVLSARWRETSMWPAVLHNIAWIVALLMVGSGLMNYYPLPSYAWILIVCSLVCFNVGVAIAGLRRHRRTDRSAQMSTTVQRPPDAVSYWVYLALILGFTVGFAVYLSTIASNFGLATLWTDPAAIRSNREVAYLEEFPLYGKVLFYLGPLCLVLTAFPHFVKGLSAKPRLLRLGIAMYLALAQVAVLQRTNLFVAILWMVGLLILHAQNARNGQATPPRSLGRTLAGVMVAIVVAIVAFQGIALALGKTGDSDSRVTLFVDPELRGGSLVSVFIYASSGVPAFGQLVESDNQAWPPVLSDDVVGDYNPQTWGRATLSGPLKLVPGVPHWDQVAPFTRLPIPSNVYTWLEPWYRDFRLVGVIMGSFLTGFVIGRASRRSHRSHEAMLFAGLLVGFTGLAAFINRYFEVMSVVLYLTIFGIWWLGHRGRALWAAGYRNSRAPQRRRRVSRT